MGYILVVDDEMNIARLLQVHLERNGYTVETAHNGAEALAKIRERLPDLLVTGVMMPEMDGFELLAILRRDPTLMDLPVILLTAKAQDNDVMTGYKTGADMYLTKPVHPEEILAFLRRRRGDGGGAAPVPAPLSPVPPSRPAKAARKPPRPYEA